MANDSIVPLFNKSQWRKFMEMVKTQNLENGSNLAIYASIIIPKTRGRNESNTKLNTPLLKILRDEERSLTVENA